MSSVVIGGDASDAGAGDNGVSHVTVNVSRANNDSAAGSGTANWSRRILLDPGANTITVRAYDGSANQNRTTQTITLTYDEPQPLSPAIVRQPQSQTVTAGSTVLFTVEATGTPPLSYQWRKGTVELVWETSSTLFLTNVQPADAGEYRVLVTNNTDLALSDPAVLTVAGAERPLQWTLVTEHAAFPPNSSPICTVFRNRMWVIGGGDARGEVSSVWSSADGVTWRLETASAPWEGRHGHSVITFQDKLWVLAGTSWSPEAGQKYYNDIWSSPDGISWTQATASASWVARWGQMATVYDGKMWVMGGWGGQDWNDVWSSTDGVSWLNVTTAAGWSRRHLSELAVLGGKLYLLGGIHVHNPAAENDIWSTTDGANWERVVAEGPLWEGRSAFGCAVLDGRVWVMGGGGMGTRSPIYNDTWSSADLVHWRQEQASAPWATRYYHQSVAFANHLWLIAGQNQAGNTHYNDVWKLGPGGPRLAAPLLQGNALTVVVSTITGKSYSLEFKDSLSDLSWTTLTTVSGDGTDRSLTDPGATGLQRFYRVREE